MAHTLGELIGLYILFRILWGWLSRIGGNNHLQQVYYKQMQEIPAPAPAPAPAKIERQTERQIERQIETPIAPDKPIIDFSLSAWLKTMHDKTNGDYFPVTYLASSDVEMLNKAIKAGKIEILEEKLLGTLYRII